MKILFNSGYLSGKIQVPVSKSAFQRMVALAAISPEVTEITGKSQADDCRASLELAQCMGAHWQETESGYRIQGKQQPVQPVWNCRESGLSCRLFTPLAAFSGTPVQITGTGTLLQRPMQEFASIFRQTSVTFSANAGKLPLHVTGSPEYLDVHIDGSLSSQFLTGLLIAAVYTGKGGRFRVHNLQSVPYIHLTLAVLRQFGIPVSHQDTSLFEIPAGQIPQGGKYTVEGDWSSAAALLVAAVLKGDIQLTGLDPASTQADTFILSVLEQAGASVRQENSTYRATASEIQPFTCSLQHCPDLFPVVSVLACKAQGTSRLHGVERLLHKETDRARALLEELGKLGASVTQEENTLCITGTGKLTGGTINSRGDHRIAMAGALAGLIAENPVIIEDAASVRKSYPEFWEDLRTLNANFDYLEK